jgi:predicted cupin superfamily sugar epimerase
MIWNLGDEPMAIATDAELRRLFGMHPLPSEGGYFVESYRSPLKVDAALLGGSAAEQRSICTAIYYMLTPTAFSALHKLKGDEIYHFYAGDPVELLQLYPNGSSNIVVLGQDPMRGMKFQHVVPGGVWQGARLLGGGGYALLGTTMAPGFEFQDFVKGDAGALTSMYPDRAAMISELFK